MRNRLLQIENIPVNSSVLMSFYPEVKEKGAKMMSLEKAGEIIRLKRDLYVVSPEETDRELCMGLIANHLLSPSYVSMHTALRHYGMIPETVYATQSMTFKLSKSFDTPVGRFCFNHISKEAYHIGVTNERNGNAVYAIATPEKALCDLVANARGVNLRYRGETLQYLEDDLRLDMDMFYSFRVEVLEAYAAVGKKSQSIRSIIKLLKNE